MGKGVHPPVVTNLLNSSGYVGCESLRSSTQTLSIASVPYRFFCPPERKLPHTIPINTASLANNHHRTATIQVVEPNLTGSLVRLGSMYFYTSTCRLSTWSSPTAFSNRMTHLGAGFALRCLQRLSNPHVATRPCRGHDNRCASGASNPVLSY